MKHSPLYILHSSFKVFCCLAMLFLIWPASFSQNQKVADSLIEYYESGEYSPEELLQLLSGIASNIPDPDQSLVYSDLLLEQAIAADSGQYLHTVYLHRGNALETKGDLSMALESYFKGVDIANASGNKNDLGRFYTAIAGVYAGMGNRPNVIQYYSNAIALLKDIDTLSYAITMENLGDAYLEWGQPDSALLLFNQSGKIFKEISDKRIYYAYNRGNIGLALAQKGQDKQAEENISEAIAILEDLGDYRPITIYLWYMSDIYTNKNDWDAAFGYSLRSLDLARQYGLKAEISGAYLKLSELYEQTGYASAALKYYRNYIAFKDSVQNITAVQQMANYELAQKQRENELLDQKRRTQKIITIAVGIALFLIILLAIGLLRRNIYIKRTKAIIERERDRSETLLLNILPEITANELKESGEVKASKVDSATVMFTDFKAFTAQAEEVDPEILVYSLGYYFSAFDDIIEKYGLEKIKTIGDSYMCAGGLPFPIENHAVKMVSAAFEIIDFVEKAKANETSLLSFEIRIGINTGPLVAGVVGSKKFSYDIWGDTVNIASRMEVSSETGRINISEQTYLLVKDTFDCEYRGKKEVKNRGVIKMYFVNGYTRAGISAILKSKSLDG
ncbi:MAG: tetratricopeptide repeat protein [Eudoraea sp.]|nr:tetratricopeptide repeat protein [Eudoraea sp.]